MKKIYICFTAFLLLLTFCSCGSASYKTDVMKVKSAWFDGEPNHAFDIDCDPVVSINEQKRGEKKTIIFGTGQYDLEYEETVTYVIGDICVDEYVTADHCYKVLLLPDGEVYAMLGASIGQIDIESTADATTVRQAVEAYLKEEVDFNSFKYCNVTCSLPEISDGFGLYSFVWYNTVGDIGTDQTLNLCVRENGEIGALWLKFRSEHSFDDVPDSISIDDYQDKIKEKMNSLFGDDLIEYSLSSSVLTRYDGKPHLDCTVAVRYSDEKAVEYGTACRILIPVE